VESRILSRAEVARRDGADPQVMRAEIEAESPDADVLSGRSTGEPATGRGAA
jgi:hypothetical protein